MTAALTLAGAIVVALITAYTTDRRLTRQIEAERQRQERELSAEAERQAQTLFHDRGLSDLATLRGLLDDAAAALDKAARIVQPIRAAAQRHDRNKASVLAAADRAQLETAERSFEPLIVRFSILLGERDSLASAVSSAVDRLHNVSVALGRLDRSSDETDRSFERVAAAVGVFGHARQAFGAAAVARAGLAIPDTAPTTRGPAR